MAGPDDYVLGSSEGERARLIQQARMYLPETTALLDRAGPPPGGRAVDVGCGPLGILDLLAERVGPSGEVVGLERDAATAAQARAVIADKGLKNVRIAQGDAETKASELGQFDFVHARLVLITVPNPHEVLRQMVALARPGGVVAVQDVDLLTLLCEPPHPAWDALKEAFLTLRGETGQDSSIGRRLYGMLRAEGLADVDVRVHGWVHRPGDEHPSQLPEMSRSIWRRVVERGLYSDGQMTELVAALERHLAEPSTIALRSLLFQVWGRKP